MNRRLQLEFTQSLDPGHDNSPRQLKAAVKPPLQSELHSFSKWHYVDTMIALILGGDFFTGSAVLAVALTKLVLRFDDKSQDPTASNGFHAEAN